MSLVVVGASRNIARVAQSLGEYLIFLQPPGSRIDQLVREDVDESISVDFTDFPALVRLVDQVLTPRRPRAVVSVTENGLEAAAILSEALGTPGTPLSVVRATRDKLLMRQQLAGRAPHLSVDFADPADESAARRLVAEHGAVIAKPRTGTASQDIRILRSIDDLERLRPREAFILEAIAEGREISVESFSRDGVHEIIGVAETGLGPNFVEVSHLMPPADLSTGDHERIGRAVAGTLDALGLRDGPAHTEVKLRADGVTVIETHNRPGGDGIADLVAITTGIDWRRASVGWPLGLRPERGEPVAGAAATVFLTAPPGTVTAIGDRPECPEGVSILDWEVAVAVGDRVLPLRGSADRLGGATLAGPTPSAGQAAIRSIVEAGIITTAPTAPDAGPPGAAG